MPFIFLTLLPAIVEVVEAVVVVGAVATTTVVAARGAGEVVNTISESSRNTSSTTAYHPETKTIYDWWCNGLSSQERDVLLGWGYSDRGSSYTLHELKSELKYRERELLTEESKTFIQAWIDENDYSSGEERRNNRRVVNPSKSRSPVWRGLKHHKGNIKTNGKAGSDRRYYQWDNRHDDIEVYDKNGNHEGSMDPRTGKMYKGAIAGRNISHLI